MPKYAVDTEWRIPALNNADIQKAAVRLTKSFMHANEIVAINGDPKTCVFEICISVEAESAEDAMEIAKNRCLEILQQTFVPINFVFLSYKCELHENIGKGPKGDLVVAIEERLLIRDATSSIKPHLS